MRNRALICLFVSAASGSLAMWAWGAEPDVAGRADLFAAQAAVRLEEVPSRLLQIEERAAQARQLPAIEDELETTSRRLAARLADVDRQGIASAMELRVAQRDVEQLRLQLTAWSAAVAARIPEIQLDLDALRTARTELVRTLRRLRREGGERSLVHRVAEALRQVHATRGRIERKLEELLHLQGRVAKERAIAEDLGGRLGASEQRMLGAFLARDSPTLWEAWARAGPRREMAATIRATVRRNVPAARDYLAAEQTLVPLIVLVFVAVSTSALVFKRTAMRIEHAPDLDVATRVLDHPVSVGFLVTPLIFLLPRYGNAPLVLRAPLALGMAIALLRVVLPLLPRGLMGGGYLTAAVLVTGPLTGLLREVPALDRSMFLLQCVVAAVVLVLARRRFPATATLARLACAAGVTLVLAAVAASAAGRVQLAHYFGNGVIRSFYVAIFAFTLLAVTDAFVAVAVHAQVSAALRRHAGQIRRRAHAIARVAVVLLFVFGVLEMFAVREAVVRALGVVFGSKLTVGAVSVSLGDLVAFAVTVWLSFRLSHVVRAFLADDVLPRMPLGRGVPYAITTISSYAVLVVGSLFALAAAGVSMDRIAVLAGAFGVGAGFGLQGIVSNFVSGLVLLFERPIQIGDIVQLGDVIGEVRRIGLRSSVLGTSDGAEIILPNSMLIAERVTNWTLSDRKRRVDVRVGVAPGTDPEMVQSLLTAVAARHPAILKDPPPEALCLGFGEGTLDFELRAWVPRADRVQVFRSELVVGIDRALAEAGVVVPALERALGAPRGRSFRRDTGSA